MLLSKNFLFLEEFQRSILVLFIFFLEFLKSFISLIQFVNSILDVTSASKNFSMSIMQQVSSAFGYCLFSLDQSDELVKFWFQLHSTVQDLFSKNLSQTSIKRIQTQFIEILENVLLFKFFYKKKKKKN